MKKILVLLFSFTCIAFSADINWVQNYDIAIKKANKTSKPIFMFVDSKNCFFCKEYKRKTLSLSSIASFINDNYIPLKVMRDDGSYPQEKLEVIGTPTTFFLDKNGNKYTSPVLGYANKHKLMKYLKKGLR